MRRPPALDLEHTDEDGWGQSDDDEEVHRSLPPSDQAPLPQTGAQDYLPRTSPAPETLGANAATRRLNREEATNRESMSGGNIRSDQSNDPSYHARSGGGDQSRSARGGGYDAFRKTIPQHLMSGGPSAKACTTSKYDRQAGGGCQIRASPSQRRIGTEQAP